MPSQGLGHLGLTARVGQAGDEPVPQALPRSSTSVSKEAADLLVETVDAASQKIRPSSYRIPYRTLAFLSERIGLMEIAWRTALPEPLELSHIGGNRPTRAIA